MLAAAERGSKTLMGNLANATETGLLPTEERPGLRPPQSSALHDPPEFARLRDRSLKLHRLAVRGRRSDAASTADDVASRLDAALAP